MSAAKLTVEEVLAEVRKQAAAWRENWNRSSRSDGCNEKILAAIVLEDLADLIETRLAASAAKVPHE